MAGSGRRAPRCAAGHSLRALLHVLLLASASGRVNSPSLPSRRAKEPATQAAASDRPLRCLMLISDTGGGHRASANALKEAIEALRPEGDVEFSITDVWTDHGVWPSTRMARHYQLLARLCGHKRLGGLFRMLWRVTFFVSPLCEVPWSEYSHLVNGRKFRDCIEGYDLSLIHI